MTHLNAQVLEKRPNAGELVSNDIRYKLSRHERCQRGDSTDTKARGSEVTPKVARSKFVKRPAPAWQDSFDHIA